MGFDNVQAWCQEAVTDGSVCDMVVLTQVWDAFDGHGELLALFWDKISEPERKTHWDNIRHPNQFWRQMHLLGCLDSCVRQYIRDKVPHPDPPVDPNICIELLRKLANRYGWYLANRESEWIKLDNEGNVEYSKDDKDDKGGEKKPPDVNVVDVLVKATLVLKDNRKIKLALPILVLLADKLGPVGALAT